MSTPRSVTLPEGVRRRRLETARGEFGALEAAPPRTPSSGSPPNHACDHRERAVLLVPGWTGSKEDFLAAMPSLSAGDRRVIAIDQRGQYETPGPSASGAYTLAAFGADVLAVARSLGPEPVHLVGHSFGGLAARAAVLQDPDRFASLALLCSGPAGLAGLKAAQLRLLATVLPHASLQRVYAWKSGLERIGRRRDQGTVPSAIEDFLRVRFVSNAPSSLAAMTRLLVTAPDLVDELAAVPIPKLVATGADDDAWPLADQRSMAERLGAPHVLIPGAGHSPAVDQPRQTATSLRRFWDGVDLGCHRPAGSAETS